MQDNLDHHHALAHSDLQSFVAAARAQPITGTCVTAESVLAGLEHARRRSHTQRMLWLSGSVAVAASLLVMAVLAPIWSDNERGPASAEVSDQSTHERKLADTVRMHSTGESEIQDEWSVALGEGTHEVELVREPGQLRPLHIELPGRTLELVEGRATIEVVGHEAAVHLHTGVAAWIGADGQRTQIEVEQLEIDTAGDADPESAAALAREADRLIAADERALAIATLRRLVETHPRATQTGAAVLDLARLLTAVNRDSEARCAYELYLARWPDSSVTAEVEAQLAGLGKAECRGLDPR
jgi:hypothetical protein